MSKFDSSNRSDMKPIILEAIDLQSPLPTSDLEEYVRASVGHAYLPENEGLSIVDFEYWPMWSVWGEDGTHSA